MEEFDFPRQNAPALYLCDFVKSVDSGVTDYVGFFTVTAGTGIREIAENLKEQGRFLESCITSLGIRNCRRISRVIHRQMRDRWGFPDPVDFTMRIAFQLNIKDNVSRLDILHA